MKFKYYAILASTSVVILALGISAMVPEEKQNIPLLHDGNMITQIGSFRGLCYGPHRDNQDPDFGIQPTKEEMEADFELIPKLTSAIRTYGATDNLEHVPALCDKYGVDCYPGAWISRFPCENERQVKSLIEIANAGYERVKAIIVGNEVLLRHDISENALIDFIERVKAETNLPIATAETWAHWLDHPDLAEAVDIMFVHIYPYWDQQPVEEGAAYVLDKWNALKAKYPDKADAMVIGETGWPNQGDTLGEAIASPENQRRYLEDFVAMADSNDIDYFYFEIFDELWKGKFEGLQGANWGMYNSDGSPKEHLADWLTDGIYRPPGVVSEVAAELPLYIYKDGCAPENKFFSSGWMGELGELVGTDTIKTALDIIDESYADDVHGDGTSIRISYKPNKNEWGGIYWQFPVNNWGYYPGYNLSGAVEQGQEVMLRFCAKGEKGGEKAKFITGGLGNVELPYRDSFGPYPEESESTFVLEDEWQVYNIDLTGKDLSSVIGGFAWVSSYEMNPSGSTIFLDEIALDVKPHVINNEQEVIFPEEGFVLGQNYPNPFSEQTRISYELAYTTEVNLSVYNVLGQEVATLVQGKQPNGKYTIEWNGLSNEGLEVPSGTYIYHLYVADRLVTTRSLIRVR